MLISINGQMKPQMIDNKSTQFISQPFNAASNSFAFMSKSIDHDVY